MTSSFTYNHLDMFNMAVNGVQAMGKAAQGFLLDGGGMNKVVIIMDSHSKRTAILYAMKYTEKLGETPEEKEDGLGFIQRVSMFHSGNAGIPIYF